MAKNRKLPAETKATETSDKELENVSGGTDLIINNSTEDNGKLIVNNRNFDTDIKFSNFDTSIKFNNNNVDMGIKQNNNFIKNTLIKNDSGIKILNNNGNK